MVYLKLNLANFDYLPQKTNNKTEESKYLNCLVMDASNITINAASMRKNAAFIGGQRQIVLLLVPVVFI